MYNRASHTNLNAIYHYLKSGSENYTIENVCNAIFDQTRSAMRDYIEEIKRLQSFDAVESFFASININEITSAITKPHYISKEMKEALYKFVTTQYNELKRYAKI